MFKVLGEHAAEILFEIITESMDDYLYIFDLQDNTMDITVYHERCTHCCYEGGI